MQAGKQFGVSLIQIKMINVSIGRQMLLINVYNYWSGQHYNIWIVVSSKRDKLGESNLEYIYIYMRCIWDESDTCVSFCFMLNSSASSSVHTQIQIPWLHVINMYVISHLSTQFLTLSNHHWLVTDMKHMLLKKKKKKGNYSYKFKIIIS